MTGNSNKKAAHDVRTKDTLRINNMITGEIAQFYWQLKQRGLVTSTRDFVIKAALYYREHLIELDLRKAQLENLQKRPADDG